MSQFDERTEFRWHKVGIIGVGSVGASVAISRLGSGIRSGMMSTRKSALLEARGAPLRSRIHPRRGGIIAG